MLCCRINTRISPLGALTCVNKRFLWIFQHNIVSSSFSYPRSNLAQAKTLPDFLTLPRPWIICNRCIFLDFFSYIIHQQLLRSCCLLFSSGNSFTLITFLFFSPPGATFQHSEQHFPHLEFHHTTRPAALFYSMQFFTHLIHSRRILNSNRMKITSFSGTNTTSINWNAQTVHFSAFLLLRIPSQTDWWFLHSAAHCLPEKFEPADQWQLLLLFSSYHRITWERDSERCVSSQDKGYIQGDFFHWA